MNHNEFGLMASDNGEAPALRGIDVRAHVTGLLAQTTLVQRYDNRSDANLELTYTFPLPVDGTLLSFSVRIGERSYRGEVIPRSQAEAAYEDAIGNGNSAFRLQEIESGIYSASLGNVMAGESVQIELTYAETLLWIGKILRYRLPTTLAPRFGTPRGMQPWQRPETSIAAEYEFALEMMIAGALASSEVFCPSHRVGMKPGTDSLVVTLAKGSTLDRDFILEIYNEEVESVGVIANACSTHVAMLTLLPPETDDRNERRDVVLLIDCSGSMQGDSIELAKYGVHLALGSLEPGERFGLVAFGTNFAVFDHELQPANRKNIDMARQWLKNLGDLGGTNIDGALEQALAMHDGAAMDILLLTDGQDWEAGKAIGKAMTRGVRIFSMGIGSAVAEDAVRRMADETGGACELVSPTEDMSERIYRHFRRMRQPRLESVDIGWPTTPLWESRPHRACFAGDAYTVFAALPAADAQRIATTFKFQAADAVSVEIPLLREETAADAVVRMAAHQRLDDLTAEDRQEWAVRYQLITTETDYLISVERTEGEKAGDLPTLQVQPQMLPAGWGGTSSVAGVAMISAPQILRHRLLQKAVRAVSDGVALKAVSVVQMCVLSDTHDRSRPTDIELIDDAVTSISKRLCQTGIPKNSSTLRTLPWPQPLTKLLDDLASTGEAEIARAFYKALLEHFGDDRLDPALVQDARDFIAEAAVSDALVQDFLACFADLWQKEINDPATQTFEIPAFLRRLVGK